MKKQFLILFAFISVLALSQVPQRFNKVIVTGDITSPKFIKTGSNADSVLLGNGSARSVNSLKTDTVSLSNRINTKATGNGTANGTNTGDETLTSIKTKLGAATPVSDGYLRYQDFADFSDRVSNATHTGDATGSAALTLATVNSNVGTFNNITINAKGLATAGSNVSYEPAITKNTAFNKNFGTTTGTVLEGRTFGTAAGSAVGDFQPIITGLTTNYIPKWNGSSMVNSLISDDGDFVNIMGVSNVLYGTVFQAGAFMNSPIASNISNQNSGSSASANLYLSAFGNSWVMRVGSAANNNNSFSILTDKTSPVERFKIETNGVVTVPSTTSSTLPTNGALVVNGGIGANHVRANNFYGNGSNLTGVQLPITLTTNGTSGAATFENGVMNVPNYTSSGNFIQNQTTSAQTGGLWVSGIIQTNNTLYAATVASNHVDVGEINTTISGTSGNATFIQPFRGIAYKKVIINLNGFIGNVNWSYPTAFTNTPVIVMTDGLAPTLITSKSTTSVTVTSATATSGILILEGY